MACSPEGRTDRRIRQFEKFHLVNRIANQLAEKYLGKDALIRMNAACGSIPGGTFDEVVDPAGAHRSLAGFTAIAEKRLAWAVTQILKEKKAGITDLEKDLYDIGAADAAPADCSLTEAFDYVMDRYLDGMPCDHTKDMMCSREEAVTWIKAMDSHEPFWTEAGGNVSDYYRLFLNYADGLLSRTGYVLKTEDNEVFAIRARR